MSAFTQVFEVATSFIFLILGLWGTAFAYGLVGGEANAIAPGKRPLSSMSPTFLESERAVAILGTPGGSRIESGVSAFAGNDVVYIDSDRLISLRGLQVGQI